MDVPQQLQPLICKALVDDNFRAALLKDPEAAAKELGVELPPGFATRISQVDAKSADKLAKQFQKTAGINAGAHQGIRLW